MSISCPTDIIIHEVLVHGFNGYTTLFLKGLDDVLLGFHSKTSGLDSLFIVSSFKVHISRQDVFVICHVTMNITQLYSFVFEPNYVYIVRCQRLNFPSYSGKWPWYWNVWHVLWINYPGQSVINIWTDVFLGQALLHSNQINENCETRWTHVGETMEFFLVQIRRL